MLISPPFLPASGLTSDGMSASSGDVPQRYPVDPMMDEVDGYELAHGIYPVAFDRRWHTGVHLYPSNQNLEVRAIADGEVVAYGVSQKPISDGAKKADGTPELNSNTGFVLLKHTTETGNGRKLTFYSLYIHLMGLDEQNSRGLPPIPAPAQYAFPSWLKHSTKGAVSGEGQKVCRKDVLGYVGKCHGIPYLHFEIFMMPDDFTGPHGYFDATQLGQQQLVTSTTSDCWGSTYYVIRGPSTFLPSPVNPSPDGNSKIHGITFAGQQAGTLADGQTLYVEAFFDRGQRYTRSWLDIGDGTPLRPLTIDPVPDAYADYEYDLFKRATALYPACPADGYEMQRFGRVLNPSITLQDAGDRRTWISVVFDADGKAGYIDISDDKVLKTSDADFPFFMSWRKVSDTNSPFDSAALCDVDALKQLLNDVKASSASTTALAATVTSAASAVPNPKEWTKEDELCGYVKTHDVRSKLRGFVCEAPSEWDSKNNETRYEKITDKGGFYENDPDGYKKFIDFQVRFQFWDAAGLPPAQKLWFFHPLEFIRHFRKCGWLNIRELAQAIPAGSNRTIQSVSKIFKDGRSDNSGRVVRPTDLYPAISVCMNRYGIASKPRMANWFGQTLHETGLYSSMRENGSVAYLTNYYEGRCHAPVQRLIGGHMKTLSPLGNCDPGDGVRFSGKGMIQLTGGDNYRNYQKYRGSANFATDPGPESVIIEAYNACDAGGYYWVSKQRYRCNENHVLVPLGKLSINYWSERVSFDENIDSTALASAIRSVTLCVNAQAAGFDERLKLTRHAYSYLSDMADDFSVDFKLMVD
ncbi:peptidase M23 [Cupriavidus basilensis]|uniref:peptidase M23 n=1 Tax=Cupriavidus basilensis TaxID=68895 RepID=UPI00157A4188|nr:peptidase M23 [Cupriavidus basilensis]NUA28138.1 peptidase M23 [Cupriavidus basilensis]